MQLSSLPGIVTQVSSNAGIVTRVSSPLGIVRASYRHPWVSSPLTLRGLIPRPYFFPRRPCCSRPSLPACGAVSSPNVCSAARVRCPPSSRTKHRRLAFSDGSRLPRASLPRPLCGHAMASPSLQQGARREAPPPSIHSQTRVLLLTCCVGTREPWSSRHALVRKPRRCSLTIASWWHTCG